MSQNHEFVGKGPLCEAPMGENSKPCGWPRLGRVHRALAIPMPTVMDGVPIQTPRHSPLDQLAAAEMKDGLYERGDDGLEREGPGDNDGSLEEPYAEEFVPMADRNLAMGVVEYELQLLLGDMITILDMSIPNKQQNAAVKREVWMKFNAAFNSLRVRVFEPGENDSGTKLVARYRR